MNQNGKFIQELEKNLGRQYSFSDFPQNGDRLASVLLPLIFVHEQWHLLFIRRTTSVLTHKGEVAFPGGGVEDQDKDYVSTALRETWEEVGIGNEKINILGSLPVVTTISNYRLHPIVGIVDWPTSLNANPDEVTRIFSIPLNWLADNNNWHEEEWESPNSVKRKVVHFDNYDGEHLWGITARITLELLGRIEKDGGTE